LAARGRGVRFWRRVVAEFDPSLAETELLAEACRLLDELDDLRAVVARDGATVTGSRGQVRAHPALGELRQARGELRRLLDALGIPAGAMAAAGDVAGVPSLASRRAAKAARTRWADRGARNA
jgi:hypothetical protein